MARWHRGGAPATLAALVVAGMAGLVAAAAPRQAGGGDPEHMARAEAARVLRAARTSGGLVVHLGAGDGRLTAALRASGAYLVHGLATDPERVEAARAYLRSRGLYGPVSVDQLTGNRLPYVDNLVRLLVVSDPCGVPREEMMRVLAPGGVLCVREADGTWRRTVKPRPAGMDEWTHFLHGPDNNAVSRDRLVGPPRHLQWVAGPRWARSHDHLATVTGCVTACGRVFAIVDEGPTAAVILPARWRLVARDAASGVLLWKRPIRDWEWHLRGFRSGPMDARTGRTLRTYPQTEGAREIVVCDGILFVVTGGAVPGLPPPDHKPAYQRPGLPPVRAQRPPYPIRIPPKALVALEAGTGRILWKKADAETRNLMPTTVCAAGGRVFFQNDEAVLCLDAGSGRVRWRAERPVSRNRPAWSAPTLVVHGKVVISADRDAQSTLLANAQNPDGVLWVVTSQGGQAPPGEMVAFSAEDGRRLWSAPCKECYNAPTDLLIADGLVWSGLLVRASEPGITRGLDPLTGEVRRTRPPDREMFRVGMVHHRCYRNKATERFLVLGRAGVEFIDLRTGRADPNHWVRGTCQLGVMPANGLLYAPPHSCACYIEAKTSGFLALAPASPSRRVPEAISAEGRLQKGPAFGRTANPAGDAAPASAPAPARDDPDWPTYRHDGARSGAGPSSVPADAKRLWRTRLGGRLTAPTVAGGRVFVAQPDAHILWCLDAATGRPVWSAVVGGRVDSPPTLWRGLALAGCRDGWIYAFRAKDGRLAWRFQAAPDDRRVVAYGRLESAWPVPGSVLVKDGVVWAVAGRSAYTDGGLFLYRLEAGTGRMLSVTRMTGYDPKTGLERQDTVRGTAMSGVLPDVLSTDGTSVFMRNARFGPEGKRLPEDVPHLFSSVGFLDDSWWHRTYWFLGTHIGNGYGGWPRPGNQVPAGRLLVVGKDVVFGFGRNVYIHTGSHLGIDNATVFHYRGGTRPVFYRLFARRRVAAAPTAGKKGQAGRAGTTGATGKAGSAGPGRKPASAKVPVRRAARARGPRYETLWNQRVPVLVRAMVLAGETLWVAGPPDPLAAENPTAALEGRQGGRLLAVAGEDGRVLSQRNLEAPPVFDGMAVARGRLFLVTLDGAVVCLGAEH